MITVSASTSAVELQSIIDSAPAGETILLGAGTFTFDRTIVINRDDIAVVGTGSELTKIELIGNARADGAFQIGSPIDVPTFSGEFVLGEAADAGAMYLHLADATGLEAGDHLWIEMENTEAYLDQIGDELWREDKPLRTSMVEVASVQGNTVRLTNGLAFDFSTIASVERIEVAQNVRLGGFSINSGLADPDPANFSNVEASFDRTNTILLSATSGAKLFDIAIINAPSNGFTFSQSIGLEASNLSVDGALNKGDGGNGYAFQLKALYDSQLVGLEAFDTRHAVLFASWTSEANNVVQVRATNRDINFHGGPDHHNVVEVLSSVRDEIEAGYLSPTLFFNDEGTSYGAPTDPDDNSVSFRNVEGTNKSEVLMADDSGVEFHARSGADLLIGGGGNDRLYADKGDDLILGSGGSDMIDGGVGNDVLEYDGYRSEYLVTRDVTGRLVIHKPDGSYDVVGAVEALRFENATVSVASLGTLPRTWFGTEGSDLIEIGSGDDVVLAGGGFDRVVSAVSYTLGDAVEALELAGTQAVDSGGNSLANTLTGNDAANQLTGLAGDDRFFGRGGNDYANGGDGDDELYGQAGNDRLFGGDGLDLLNGGAGADTFVFSFGRDEVEDFSLRSGDRVDIGLSRFDTPAEFLFALRLAAASGADTYEALGIDVDGSGNHVELRVEGANGEMLAMSINGASLEALLVNSDWII